MLKIDRDANRLTRIPNSSLADAEHLERKLQDMICRSPDAFCDEIEERLWIIGQEVRPSASINDRIDILAVDQDGNSVVIELKRGNHELHLLKAISYAGMIAQWSDDDFIETLAAEYKQSIEDARSDLEDHVESEPLVLNVSQRIILVAEWFDPALLVSAEWLHERFDVDIRCYRLTLSREGNSEYLDLTCIYPPTQISALKRGPGSLSKGLQDIYTDWESALGDVSNTDVADFYRHELVLPEATRPEDRVRYGQLIYQIGKKRRLTVNLRDKFVYVWQDGRFENDTDFWSKFLSDPHSITPVRKGIALRFRLNTAADTKAFANAAHITLAQMEFVDPESGQDAALEG